MLIKCPIHLLRRDFGNFELKLREYKLHYIKIPYKSTLNRNLLLRPQYLENTDYIAYNITFKLSFTSYSISHLFKWKNVGCYSVHINSPSFYFDHIISSNLKILKVNYTQIKLYNLRFFRSTKCGRKGKTSHTYDVSSSKRFWS